MKTCQGGFLGLWGTSNPNRVPVTIDPEDSESIIGFVREISELRWVVKGDKDRYVFGTPRMAAEYGYQVLWKIEAPPPAGNGVMSTLLPDNRRKGLDPFGTR